MPNFRVATLTYIAQGKASNGSPVELTYTRDIKVKEIKNFSLNYYTMGTESQRSMRNSKNIVVPKWVTEDVFVEGKRFELLYVQYNGLNYHIKNALRYYKSSLRMILDIEELK